VQSAESAATTEISNRILNEKKMKKQKNRKLKHDFKQK